MYARWKKRFLEAGREGLRHGVTSGDVREKEIKDLKELLAQLYVENQFLKKPFGWENEETYQPRNLDRDVPAHG
jgi:hypothetical protein